MGSHPHYSRALSSIPRRSAFKPHSKLSPVMPSRLGTHLSPYVRFLTMAVSPEIVGNWSLPRICARYALLMSPSTSAVEGFISTQVKPTT